MNSFHRKLTVAVLATALSSAIAFTWTETNSLREALVPMQEAVAVQVADLVCLTRLLYMESCNGTIPPK